jgi:hypothetical protein
MALIPSDRDRNESVSRVALAAEVYEPAWSYSNTCSRLVPHAR